MQAKPLRRAVRGWPATVLDRFTRDQPAVALCALVLAAVPLAIHAYKYPDFSGFWAGLDQQRYLDSARAWSQLDVSPGHHHYLPLYPLLGAAFVWLTPWQPFVVPDIVCLVASLLVFVRIARRLTPGWPDSVSALCFLIATMGGRVLVAVWVVPWSTTGSAPCQFAALLLALRFGERPSPGRAFALGVATALVAGFRPSDAAILAFCCGLYSIVALARTGLRPSSCSRIVGAALLGLALGLLPVAAAHIAIFGAHEGAYLGKVAGIGLEWRLLAQRWVMLVAGPRPLLPEGRGLAEVFPWLLPGLAGLMLELIPNPGRRLAPMALVAGAVALHWALYLAYRDLQPYGLWRFYNVHYFKWTFPFLVLWAARWGAKLASSTHRWRASLALAAAALTLAWRPVPINRTEFAILPGGDRLVLPDGFEHVDQAVRLPLTGNWSALYFGKVTIEADGVSLTNTRDFKLLPMPSGALLIALRPWTGPSTLYLPQGVGLASGQAGSVFRIGLRFALPWNSRL